VNRTDEAFVADILAAAKSISDYVSITTEDDFHDGIETNDRAIRDGIIHQVSIVGEAASKLSLPFRKSHAGIPWSQVVGMRNIVIHQYWEINLAVIWEVATEEIPALLRQLAPPSGGKMGERSRRRVRR
jgi:uncharacterized protein with HEPN domain